MPKSSHQQFRLVSAWTIHQAAKSLIISGGADAKYKIELETSQPSFFTSLKSNQYFRRDDLSASDQRVLEELLTAEIIVPELKKKSALKVTVLGDGGFSLTSNKNITVVKDNQKYDVAVVIRIKNTYADLLHNIGYQNIAKPHLFVDLGFHHTFSVGPLVFPGETACIACLQGRISTRWGDEFPPPLPRIASKYKPVVTELLVTELERVAEGDTSLTNKTFAWNFQDRTVRKDQLLKVPLCPICTQNSIDPGGVLALPWGKDESTRNPVR